MCLCRKIPFLVFFVQCILFLATEAVAQRLSLYDALQRALHHNETILYAAEQYYLSARAQRNAAEALYNITANASVTMSRSLAKTQLTAQSTERVLSQVQQSQEAYPDLNLQQVIATPLGSKLVLTGGMQTIATGLASFGYQSRPTFGLSYQQPLSASGIASGHADIKNANLSYDQAEMSYELQREQLALSVVQSYFQLWQAARSVQQSVADVESAKRMLEIAEMKLRQGSIAEFELLNLRVQHRLAEDNLLQTRNSLRTQEVGFLRLLGMPPNSTALLEESIPIDTIAFTLENAVVKAMENRMEIRQANIALSLAALNRDQTSSLLSPSLQLNATYTLSSNFEPQVFRSFTMPNYGWNILGTISVPLTDGGRTSSLAEVAERNIAVLEKSISLLKEEIAIDVETSYRTLALDRRRFASLELSLEAAAEALKIAESRFQSGQISSMEIENVRNRYNAARNALDGARISYVIERAGLAKAMSELMSWIESLKP